MEKQQSARSRLAEYFRDAIQCGKLQPGDHLPPARQLAAEWNTPESNVHGALAKLVREGLIERRPRLGTVVSAPAYGIRQAAIYFDWSATTRHDKFSHLLLDALIGELERRSIGCRVIFDTESGGGFAELADLAERGLIQGAVLRGLSQGETERFRRLGIPFTALTGVRIVGGVNFFDAALANRMLAQFRPGSRIGAIFASMVRPEAFLVQLERAAERAGCTIDGRAVLVAADLETRFDVRSTAFRAMERILALPERPDSLLLFSDELIGGVTMAAYRYRVDIPGDFQLVIHSTVENPVIYPFPCVSVSHRIGEVAATLVSQLVELRMGRKAEAGELSLTVEKHN